MASWRVCSANTPTRYTVHNGKQLVLGRSDGPMPITVSRKQCIIAIGNDGTGTVTSVGMGSTGVRENASTLWLWLRANQSKVIADGTMVSLDSNNPEGHVFTCQVVDTKDEWLCYALGGTLIQNKRQRVDEKGELLILARSYSHAHTRTLILARSHTQTRNETSYLGYDRAPPIEHRRSRRHKRSTSHLTREMRLEHSTLVHMLQVLRCSCSCSSHVLMLPLPLSLLLLRLMACAIVVRALPRRSQRRRRRALRVSF